MLSFLEYTNRALLKIVYYVDVQAEFLNWTMENKDRTEMK